VTSSLNADRAPQLKAVVSRFGVHQCRSSEKNKMIKRTKSNWRDRALGAAAISATLLAATSLIGAHSRPLLPINAGLNFQSPKLTGTFWAENDITEQWKLAFPSGTQATFSVRTCGFGGCEKWKSITGNFTLRGKHISIDFAARTFEGEFSEDDQNQPQLKGKMKMKSSDAEGDFTFHKRNSDWDPN
jgi:hypothetical protein